MKGDGNTSNREKDSGSEGSLECTMLQCKEKLTVFSKYLESSSHSFSVLLCDLEEVAYCLWVLVCTSVRGDVVLWLMAWILIRFNSNRFRFKPHFHCLLLNDFGLSLYKIKIHMDELNRRVPIVRISKNNVNKMPGTVPNT